ncbi:MAG: hypothetical protein IJE02_05130 [Clostridia bacterium]|nr:hypothetical protein [Clostridia bacterium]
MLKKVFSLLMVSVMAFSVVGCSQDGAKEDAKNQYTLESLPKYESQEFEISGFWAPYDISEEGLKIYKEAGFNTLAMINHSLGNTSEEQFYLGSKRTMTALENCKKVGLNAILNYNDWKAEQCEGEGYNGETPFSKYDLYGDYKDIITGVHICDEPNKETMDEMANKTLIEDFKKVYPNASYIINLSDITWPDGRGYRNYDELLNHYSTAIMSQFDVPYISVDCYPFWGTKDMHIIENYYKLANIAKQHDAKTTMILQSSTGNEFKDTLSEGDLRWQAYLAIAFGADSLQYYCYSLPKGRAYNYCVLNEDGTPSVLYDYVKEINAEVQMFADSVLAYDWDDALVVSGTDIKSLRGSCLQYNPVDFKYKKFDNAAHYVGSQGTQDILVSHFLSEKYGEAYMFVNIAVDNGVPNNVIAEFKDCGAIAVYGGADYSGTPEIIELDENGKVSLDFEYGEGAFIIPLK